MLRQDLELIEKYEQEVCDEMYEDWKIQEDEENEVKEWCWKQAMRARVEEEILAEREGF